jgi:hypothetical protein
LIHQSRSSDLYRADDQNIPLVVVPHTDGVAGRASGTEPLVGDVLKAAARLRPWPPQGPGRVVAVPAAGETVAISARVETEATPSKHKGRRVQLVRFMERITAVSERVERAAARRNDHPELFPRDLLKHDPIFRVVTVGEVRLHPRSPYPIAQV